MMQQMPPAGDRARWPFCAAIGGTAVRRAVTNLGARADGPVLEADAAEPIRLAHPFESGDEPRDFF